MGARPLTCADHADALVLYRELASLVPIADDRAAFDTVISHPGTTVWGVEDTDRIVAMATLHLMPNVTYSARPYALIENVVTLAAHREQGHGATVMRASIDAAWRNGAYKIMLLTGTRRGAHGFYERLGFRNHDKHAMTMWHDLPPEAAARIAS